MKNINYRILDSEFVNFRAVKTESGRFLEGYASVFNQRSKPILENGKVFYEIIAPGAFDEVLATKPDVKLNYNHSRDGILARTKSGTLELSVDDYGLKFRASVPNTTLGNDVYEMVSRMDLFENSFAFFVRKGDDVWTVDEQGNNIRTILRISRLIDVSVVTDGAYANTLIEARDNENRKTITITICDDEEDPEEVLPEPEIESIVESISTDSSTGEDVEEAGCKK